ncbi:hypothetical protein [Thermoflavifilum sp.]|jgi:fumarate reductase subunit C|nr:hypothetical protein [Thermoflavifilum sp.]
MKHTATKPQNALSKLLNNPVVLVLGVIVLSFLLFYVLQHLFS